MNIDTAPREIQLIIFGQLKVPDLVRLSETCHCLKDVARDPSLWKKLTLTYERIKNKTEACAERDPTHHLWTTESSRPHEAFRDMSLPQGRGP